MGVPEKYIDKMFAVPSNDVYMITKEEIDDLDGKTPYYEELLFSRCGSITKHEENDYMECLIKENSNKCSNVSAGYLSYLETKVDETEDCWWFTFPSLVKYIVSLCRIDQLDDIEDGSRLCRKWITIGFFYSK